MDFGVIQLDDEYQRFQDEVSALLDEHVADLGPERRRFGADEVFDRGLDREAGGNEGWSNRPGRLRTAVPASTVSTSTFSPTSFIVVATRTCGGDLVWAAVEKFGQPDLVEELRPKVGQGRGAVLPRVHRARRGL